MEPLILKFKELAILDDLNSLNVEYSEELNLSVIKQSGQPAVTHMNLGTETFTRSQGEGSDADRSGSFTRFKNILS